MRLMLTIALTAVVFSHETVGEQSSSLDVEHSWPGGMTAHICMEHDFKVRCGWEMEITFSKPLSNMEIWDATVKSTAPTPEGGTKMTVKNRHWSGNHQSGTCTRFNAFYNGMETPDVTGQFTRVCENGQFDDVAHDDQDLDEGPDQNSTLEVEHHWPGGMTAYICLEHDFRVTCGWEMEVTFDKRISNLEIWDAVILSTSDDDKTIKLRNLEWTKKHKSGACTRFNAYFSGLTPPSATAKFTRYCFKDEWTDLQEGESTEQPDDNQKEPQPADYAVYIESSWNKGISGEICLYHTANITCGFDAEIIFSPPARKLEIWTMAIIGKEKTTNEIRFKVRNMIWGTEQPNNPTCHRFLARHKRNSKPTIISGHYTRVCHEGEDNTNPNEGGTVPPSTTTTTSTTTPTTSTTTPSTTTSSVTSSQSTTASSTQGSSQASSSSSFSSSSSSESTTERQTTAETSSTTSPASSSSTSSTTVGPSPVFDYRQALSNSMLFYYVQRSGPINDNIILWRTADSAMADGSDVGRDLTGGWYDAGDHVKFGFPMAASATNLLWGFLQWGDAYSVINQPGSIYEILRHPLDYFLKCWDNGNQIFYGQVGSGHIDHASWGRPENMAMSRPTYKLDADHGGSDLAGETAAALAAGSLAFRSMDQNYADDLLEAAIQLYNFADQHRQEYHNSIPDASDFYRSHSGYMDELCWGAAWLLKATGDESYRAKAEATLNQLGNPQEFSWDGKAIGCYVLMHQMSSGNKKADYAAKINAFLDMWLNFNAPVTKTPCGLAWLRQWGSLRYSANTALIALMAADQGIRPTEAREWAEKQIKYMLGANPHQISYQVGYGDHFPLRPHHKAASCPSAPAPCNWSNFNDPQPNPHELTGALVGGPGQNDEYEDKRDDYVKNEVTTDYNAGFQSALAGLISLDMRGILPDATPECPAT